MNFEQAVHEMKRGHYIRLSDWMGYWFLIPEKENEQNITDPWPLRLRGFTRDGDILDTPNIARYKDRDDWEVVAETGWSFGMALRFMKNGKAVTKSGWGSARVYIKLIPSVSLNMDYGTSVSSPYIALFSPENIPTQWVPNTEDMMRNDWQIVNA